VAKGIYKPDQQVVTTARSGSRVTGSGDRTATFQLKNGVTIKGGYAGFGELIPNARDTDLYQTILSGDLNGNDRPSFVNNSENSFHVVTGSGTNNTSVLEGLIVTGGNADGPFHNSGGGMYIERGSPMVINCRFTNNSDVNGGGMGNKGSPALVNCIFGSNSVSNMGRGMFNYGLNGECRPMLTNCIFYDNSALSGGGMLNGKDVNTTLTNCTFTGNHADGIRSDDPLVMVVNTILWNNSPSEISFSGSSITVTYSNVQGGWSGEGNINANPLFVNASEDDYRMQPNSPCVDVGNNAAIPEFVLTDLDGNPRIVDSTVDMGAYETIPPPNVFYVDAIYGNDNNNGLTLQTAFATIQKGLDEAVDGESIRVYPGLYQEKINFMGKRLKVDGVITSPYGAPVLQNPGDYAVSFYSGEDRDSVLRNFIISDSFVGVFIAGSSPTIYNLTIVNNKYGIEAYADSEPDISNCILWNNSDDDLFQCRTRYSCIERRDEGEGNISLDPLFVDPDSGDYHLRSERGRYWPEHDVWVLDKVTSPCIDGGDPNIDPLDEPMPNGGRINMGAYGGTTEASLSPGGQSYSPLGKASNPNPADGVIGVNTNIILSWTAGLNAVWHDVYFGTNPMLGNAELVSAQQTDTTCQFSGSLAPGTTYYWRVDEFDGVFTYKGNIWSFTTSHINAFNPSPPDGAVHEDSWVNLSWSPGADAASHIVYFGDNIQDVNEGKWNTFLGNENSTSYVLGLPGHDYPDGLVPGTTYYWRIDEVNNIHPESPSKGDVWSFTVPHMIAFNPVPPDGTIHEDTWINLSWSPGDYAVSHDVYIGEHFEDVSNGAAGTFYRNQPAMFVVVGFPGFPYPDGLAPGTTYYWRIDEVNDLHPKSPWEGDVWSFSIPPGTAYFPNPADNAESVALDVVLRWTSGFGAKLHTVYFGDNFEDVSNATGGFPQGTRTYTPGPLELAKTYYWRVDEFDGIQTHKGEIWSFITEGAVGNPNPSNGAVDVKLSPILTWTHGIYADSHQVYFGTNKDAVENAHTGSPEYKGSDSLGSESYDPGRLSLNNTYYWRIDEVNTTYPDSPWKGPVWSFTTVDFIVVDDFESYNDLDPEDPASRRIFVIWVDGWDDPDNGSIVGETYWWGWDMIVHSGHQSIPFTYDNSVGISEATATIADLEIDRDWTIEGVRTLSLWYRGDSANSQETMYVVLNGTAGVDNDNLNATQVEIWTEWRIDLQEFADQGVNLEEVNSITLGLGNRSNPIAGGSGRMYFDNIRLYRSQQPYYWPPVGPEPPPY
jgi:hypothetical protein